MIFGLSTLTSDAVWFGFINGGWIILALLWGLPWKGVALWRAARREEKWWFIALLLVNTVGILEILYIFFFSKKDGCVCVNCDTEKGGQGEQPSYTSYDANVRRMDDEKEEEPLARRIARKK